MSMAPDSAMVRSETENAAQEAEAPRAPRVQHLPFLDGLRALAALYVVNYHILAYYHASLPPRVQTIVSPFWLGHFAVDLFIVLSGFSLMLPIVRGDGTLRGGAKQFFLKRARRILPPYYSAMTISLVLIALLIGHKTNTPWDLSLPVKMRGILAHLFLVQDAFSTTWSKINSPFWSISVEWRIYLIFPLLVLAWRRIGSLMTTAIALAVSYALVFVFLHIYPFTRFNSQTNGVTPQYLALFAFGMLGAGIVFSGESLLARFRNRGRWWPITLLFGVAAAVATFRWQHGGNNNDLPGVDLWVGLCAVSLLAAVSLREGIVCRVLSSRPLTKIGQFAYSIYLVHFPVLQIVWQYFVQRLHLGPEKAIFVHAIVGIPAAVGFAYLFFLACERPFLSARQPKSRANLSAQGG